MSARRIWLLARATTALALGGVLIVWSVRDDWAGRYGFKWAAVVLAAAWLAETAALSALGRRRRKRRDQ